MQLSIRKKGFIKLAIGSIGFGLVFYYIASQGLDARNSSRSGIGYMIAVGFPGAIALAGVLQLVTGRPFSELEEWWGSLKGWQRGLLGVFVVALALVITMGAMVAAAMLGFI